LIHKVQDILELLHLKKFKKWWH